MSREILYENITENKALKRTKYYSMRRCYQHLQNNLDNIQVTFATVQLLRKINREFNNQQQTVINKQMVIKKFQH